MSDKEYSFYQRNDGVWIVNGNEVPPGTLQLILHPTESEKLRLIGLNNYFEPIPIIKANEISKDDLGTKYTNRLELITETKNFFLVPGTTQLIDNSGELISVQNPLAVNSGRVYENDIDLTRSINNTFGDSVEDILKLFNNLHTTLEDNTSNNPKVLFIHFNWSIVAAGISLECNEPGGFSNTKVEILRGGGQSITIRDDSLIDTIRNGEFYAISGSGLPFSTIGFNAIRITFSTDNPIKLTNISISKTSDTNAYLLANNTEDNILEFIRSSSGYLNVFSADKEYEAYENKWGQNEDIDTASVPETIYDGSDLYTYTDLTVGATYSASSDDIADTALDLIAELITLTPGTGDFQRELVTLTLNGQTKVNFAPPSGNPVLACNRAYNANGTLFTGTIYIYESTAILSGGIPTDSTLIRAIITPVSQQSRQAVYVIPDLLEDGTRIIEAHFLSWNVSIVKATNIVLDVQFMVEEYGKVFRARDIDTARNERPGGYVWGDKTPLKIPTKSKVEVRAVNISANDGNAVAKFKLQLVTENEPN